MSPIYSRRVSFLIDVDLAKGSKEAHATTVAKIATILGKTADDLMTEHGYKVTRSTIATTLHTVRHIISQNITGKPVRALRRIS